MANLGTDSGASEASASAAPYTRKATGLVRELPLFDMVTYSASVAAPVGISLTLSLFFVYAAFPGANVPLALLLGFVGVAANIAVFASLASAMPRIGGDYTYLSRILHPAVGLASNFCVMASSGLAISFISVVGVKAIVAPAFASIGTLTGANWWIELSETISTNGWSFAIGGALVLLISFIAIMGTKRAGRVISILYLICLGGTVLTVIILALTSHASFISHVNNFSEAFTGSKDTYNDTIKAGSEAGIVYPDKTGYDFWNTIGAIFITYGLTAGSYAACYMAGEMRGAGRRSRQMSAMMIAAVGQGLLLLIGVLVFESTMGLDFLASASNGLFGVPVAPYVTFFASLVTSTPVAIILAIALIFGIPPLAYANIALVSRGPFAWAFDGLLPRGVTKVNARTHTPVVAISVVAVLAVGGCAWAAFSESFLEVFSYLVLLGFFTYTLVAVAAIAMPKRLPHVYKGGPADWKILGIPALPAVGAVSLVWNAGMIFLGLHFHENLGISSAWIPIAVLVGLSLAGTLFYFIARAVQANRGVNIDLAYKQIPPE